MQFLLNLKVLASILFSVKLSIEIQIAQKSG